MLALAAVMDAMKQSAATMERVGAPPSPHAIMRGRKVEPTVQKSKVATSLHAFLG